MVERPGMKPACCIRLRDLIAETDQRRKMSARRFPGIDRRVIPRLFVQVSRSPLRFQNGRMMPLPVVRDILTYPDAVYCYVYPP